MTVSIRQFEKATVTDLPPGFSGDADARALFQGERDPLHLYAHRLRRGGTLRAAPPGIDCVIYVWKGSVRAGGRVLAAGSSLVVEHGAAVEISGVESASELLTFFAARMPDTPRAGGHVHLLPTEQVPRVDSLGSTGGAGGGMHANATCPTCEVWLHENTFHPQSDEAVAANLEERGVHSHSEDEIIFVTSGEILLGKKRYGPGTALGIDAQTFYSFGYGRDGMKFINFRPRLPSEIKLKDGGSMDEVAFWRDRVGAPQYLEPLNI